MPFNWGGKYLEYILCIFFSSRVGKREETEKFSLKNVIFEIFFLDLLNIYVVKTKIT